MHASIEHSHIAARDVRKLNLTAEDAANLSMSDVAAFAKMGIGIPSKMVTAMHALAMDGFGMDDNQGLTTQASIGTPVQFLQNWLPGFVRVITAARKIDELVGITTSGSWEDQEIVQGILEPVGQPQVYGDYTNVPLSSWNTNFVRRTVQRFEKGMKVGMLEEARAARIRISASAEKRNAAALSLEINRNLVGFYGYNGGNDLTYGFLNDPILPAYVTVAATGTGATTTWSTKTFLNITADIRAAAAKLNIQSQGVINPRDQPTVLAVPTGITQYLTVTSDFGVSVEDWITKAYKGNMKVIDAPQFNGANGGANVFYLYAESVEDGASDDSRTFIQVVPAKFQALGVEKQAKAYVEDYVSATAGIMTKRPYAVVRFSGI
jgi:hypothetical protein